MTGATPPGQATEQPTEQAGEKSGEQPPEPLLRVVRGDPEPDELAALVAVVTARAAGAAFPSARRRWSAWASPGRRTRPPLRPGPDAWRLSTLPR